MGGAQQVRTAQRSFLLHPVGELQMEVEKELVKPEEEDFATIPPRM